MKCIIVAENLADQVKEQVKSFEKDTEVMIVPDRMGLLLLLPKTDNLNLVIVDLITDMTHKEVQCIATVLPHIAFICIRDEYTLKAHLCACSIKALPQHNFAFLSEDAVNYSERAKPTFAELYQLLRTQIEERTSPMSSKD